MQDWSGFFIDKYTFYFNFLWWKNIGPKYMGSLRPVVNDVWNEKILRAMVCKHCHARPFTTVLSLNKAERSRIFRTKKHIPARVCRYAYGYACARMKTPLWRVLFFKIFIHRSNYRSVFFFQGISFHIYLILSCKKNPMKNNWISKHLKCIFDIFNYNKSKIKQTSNRKMQLVNCLSKLVE